LRWATGAAVAMGGRMITNYFGHHPWWMWVFFTIGVIAATGGLVSLFFALGRRPERMWTKEIGAVDSDDFIRPVAALLNAPVRRGGHATALNNGDGWLSAMLADFKAATRSITFSAYIWEPGRMSDIVADALSERARAGVAVRLLLDGLGGIRCPGETIDRMRAAGVRVDKFRPFTFGKLSRFHKRNHRRAIVIDGRIGYTGGMAVGDKWLGNASTPEEWRDNMVRVTGCMAESLQSAFAELWAYVTGEVLTGDAYFPVDAEEDSDARSVGIASAPSSEDHPLRLFYFLSFLAARKKLYIASSYFVPDKHTRKVVADRARAGVDVRILVPNEMTDAKPIRLAGRSYYQSLLNAGVRIYEYQPNMMHAKYMVADSVWSVVGSANLDIRSKEINAENVLGVLDSSLAGELETSFLADLGKAREIDAKTWRKRGIGTRILERICVFFAEQY
jgi:cardiolipin synthase